MDRRIFNKCLWCSLEIPLTLTKLCYKNKSFETKTFHQRSLSERWFPHEIVLICLIKSLKYLD